MALTGVAGQIYWQAPQPIHSSESTDAISTLGPGWSALRAFIEMASRGQRRTQRPHPMQFAGSTLAFPITKICFSSVDSGVRAPVGQTSVHRVQLYRQ